MARVQEITTTRTIWAAPGVNGGVVPAIRRVRGSRWLSTRALNVLLACLGGLLGGCGGGGSTSSNQPQPSPSPSATAATPTLSPAAGTYTAPQTVTISDATAGATIFFTRDGSTPTVNSTKYSGPFTVASTETVEAIAAVSGETNSAVGSAAYVITTPQTAATPTFAVVGMTLTIADATPNSTILFTATPGSTGTPPTATNSTTYTGPIPIPSGTTTFEAIATAANFTASPSAADTITNNPAPQAGPLQNCIQNFNDINTFSGQQVISLTVGCIQGPSNVVQVSNPDDPNGKFGHAVMFDGGAFISIVPDANGVTATIAGPYILDQGVRGQGAITAKVYANISTATTNASAGTASLAVAQTNSVAVPFSANGDGSFPTLWMFNTGNGLVAAANNSLAADFIPAANGVLGTPVALSHAPTSAGNVSNAWIDGGGNVGVVWGTGAGAVLNVYDTNGNWLLSASGQAAALVSINATNGAPLGTIPAGASVTALANAIEVSANLGQSVVLYGALQAPNNVGVNLVSFNIQPPAMAGTPPAVTPSNVMQEFSSNVTVLGDAPPASGALAPIHVLDRGTNLVYSFNVTASGPSNAQTLVYGDAGSQSLTFTGPAIIVGTPVAVVALPTSGNQSGLFALTKPPAGSGGNLGPATMTNATIVGTAQSAAVVDLDNNIGVASMGSNVGIAVFNPGGISLGIGSFLSSNPFGGTLTTLSPMQGTRANISNGTNSGSAVP